MGLHEFDFDAHIFAAAEPLDPSPRDADWVCGHGEGPCGICANYLLGDEPPSRGCCSGVGGHDNGCEGVSR